MFISKQTSDQSGSIVSSHANQHKSDFSGVSLGLELVLLLGDFSVGNVVSVLVNFYIVVIVGGLD